MSEPEADMGQPESDPFFGVYDRDDIAYGTKASRAIDSFLEQCGLDSGRALDLGAGAGRDTISLARRGLQVRAVDLSQRGLHRIEQRAEAAGVRSNVKTDWSDVRELDLPADTYDVVVATTVLDHIPSADADALFARVAASLTDRGVLYVEVHTSEDPGSGVEPGLSSEAAVSETAGAVINYFQPNRLVRLASEPIHRLRALFYEERREWDYTHGPEHQHGKAILLAVRSGYHPDWFGVSRPFPRNPESSA
ncbi:MAG: class I SAM-dependent methyltransferase [Planctomycetota bacterium]